MPEVSQPQSQEIKSITTSTPEQDAEKRIDPAAAGLESEINRDRTSGLTPDTIFQKIANFQTIPAGDALSPADRKVSPVTNETVDNDPKTSPDSITASLPEKDMIGYVARIAKVADEALAANDPQRLQMAINSIPEDTQLRARVRQMLRTKGIASQSKEEEAVKKGDTQEKAVNPLLIDYAAIAKQLTLNDQDPPLADSLVAPMMGNFFDDEDKPTLAGKVAAKVYEQLAYRPKDQSQKTEKKAAEDERGRADYVAYIQAVNEDRQKRGLNPIALHKQHTSGMDDFHVDGKGYLDDFEFYFNKSGKKWKSNPAQLTRGYVTINPEDSGHIQRDFVNLSQVLYDSGIDFTAKASGSYGTAKRTDNMVFYINPSDQDKASQLMKDFLTEKKIGQGHVLAAIPSAQDGLSWAADPDKSQTQVWQEIAGTKTEASFNSYVATRLMPDYLTRIADAHEKKGNKEEAEKFRNEAKRTQAVIDTHKPTL